MLNFTLTMDSLTSFALALPLSFALFSCSPAPEPLAQGSAQYRAKVCMSAYGGIGAENESGESLGLPDVPVSNTPSNNPGAFVVDGERSPARDIPYEVSCTVTGSDDLRIQARLRGPNVSPSAADFGTSTRVELSAVVDAESGEGIGQVSFFTATTRAVTPLPDTTCRIVASPSPLHVCSDQSCTGGVKEPGSVGRMWVQFECDRVKSTATGVEDAGCQSDGTLVLERCAVR